jgi:hypothetical protein
MTSRRRYVQVFRLNVLPLFSGWQITLFWKSDRNTAESRSEAGDLWEPVGASGCDDKEGVRQVICGNE